MSREGAFRLASTALRTNGGTEVILRLPGMAASGTDAEQLGLGTPQFQDVPIGPAVWHKAGTSPVLLLASTPIAALVASEAYASAESLFEEAVGVVVDDVVYGILRSEALETAGVPCAYRLTMQRPARG